MPFRFTDKSASETADKPDEPRDSLSPFLPLQRPVFRMLWSVWMAANICMWMNDVAAAWMMTSLTTAPIWVAAVAILLAVTVFMGAMTPPLLLALTFANGIGLAMRWPVFSAIVPDLVPRPQLPAALALNGIAMPR